MSAVPFAAIAPFAAPPRGRPPLPPTHGERLSALLNGAMTMGHAARLEPTPRLAFRLAIPYNHLAMARFAGEHGDSTVYLGEFKSYLHAAAAEDLALLLK